MYRCASIQSLYKSLRQRIQIVSQSELQADKNKPLVPRAIGTRNLKLLYLVVIALICVVVGFAHWIQHKIEAHEKRVLHDTLNLFVANSHEQIDVWRKTVVSRSSLWAATDIVRETSEQLLKVAPTQAALLNSGAQARLRKFVKPLVDGVGHIGYFIISPQGINLASMRDENIGIPNLLPLEFRRRILDGDKAVSLPQESDVPLLNSNGELMAGAATMFAAAPVRSKNNEIIAIFAVRLRADEDLTRTLSQFRIGKTGETYAFNKDGQLLTASRFEPELRRAGLLEMGRSSTLNVSLRDPGTNLLVYNGPPLSNGHSLPFTYAVQQALGYDIGFNLDGYGDYLGVPVIGAWMWDADFNIGIVTEIQAEEAYASMNLAIHLSQFLTTLFVLSMLTALFVFRKNQKQLLANEHRLEEAVFKRTRELEEANKAKDRFLSSMSHELRTPLNAVIGFAQLLELREDNDAQENEFLHEISKAGGHLLDLINDILDLSKIESGTLNFSMETVDVRALVKECFALTGTMAAQRGIKQINRLKETEPAYVLADYTRLKQILLNLISNAIKYNGRNGAVSINFVCKNSSKGQIVIEDNGPGIPLEKQNLLFKPFERAGAENSEIEGTGIGLVISKRLADLMDGEIGFSSELGIGTRFWVEFSLSEPQNQKDIPYRSSKPGMTFTADAESADRRKILYVEDNPANFKLVRSIVEDKTEFELIHASSGELGLELAVSLDPDMIILDIGLPGIDGITLIQKLKQSAQFSHTPIIALSANATKRDIEKGLGAGFDCYLTKPINVDEFMKTLKRYTA